jgi:hypothetical protein
VIFFEGFPEFRTCCNFRITMAPGASVSGVSFGNRLKLGVILSQVDTHLRETRFQ